MPFNPLVSQLWMNLAQFGQQVWLSDKEDALLPALAEAAAAPRRCLQTLANAAFRSSPRSFNVSVDLSLFEALRTAMHCLSVSFI